MLGALPSWIEAWGKDLIFLAGLVTAIGIISRTRFAKYVWQHLVSEPMAHWSRGLVSEVLDEKVVQPNGGSSLRDAVDGLSQQVESLGQSQETLLNWTAEEDGRRSDWMEYVDARFEEVNGRFDRLCAEMQKGKRGAA